jgi:hypothetical protein
VSGLSRFVSGFKTGSRLYREQMRATSDEPQIPGWLTLVIITAFVVVLGVFAYGMAFGNPGATGLTGRFLMPFAIVFIGLPSSVAAFYKYRAVKRDIKGFGPEFDELKAAAEKSKGRKP